MLNVVTMKEIEAIFEITDRLGISREWIEIPLGPESPGIDHRGRHPSGCGPLGRGGCLSGGEANLVGSEGLIRRLS